MRNDEKEFGFRHLSISEGKTRCEIELKLKTTLMIYTQILAFALHEIPTNARIRLIFEGTFLSEYHNDRAKDFLFYYLSLNSNGESRNISKLYQIGIEEHSELDHIEMSERSETIYLDDSDFEIIKENKSMLILNLYTHFTDSFPASVAYDPSPLNKDAGIILAAVVLVGLYVLIVFELVHRTLAAMIAAAMAIGKLQKLD
jgi:P protein